MVDRRARRSYDLRNNRPSTQHLFEMNQARTSSGSRWIGSTLAGWLPDELGLLHAYPRCIGMSLFFVSASVHACWQEAAERYRVNPHVLYAIAKCESGLDPKAVNRGHLQRTGTYDIGLMQINSSNLKALRVYGIEEQHLYDGCTSIHVGAWILADKMRVHGNSWEAIGAYNAACTQLKGEACAAARNKYARCVYRHLPDELKQPLPGAAGTAGRSGSPMRSSGARHQALERTTEATEAHPPAVADARRPQ